VTRHTYNSFLEINWEICRICGEISTFENSIFGVSKWGNQWDASLPIGRKGFFARKGSARGHETAPLTSLPESAASDGRAAQLTKARRNGPCLLCRANHAEQQACQARRVRELVAARMH